MKSGTTIEMNGPLRSANTSKVNGPRCLPSTTRPTIVIVVDRREFGSFRVVFFTCVLMNVEHVSINDGVTTHKRSLAALLCFPTLTKIHKNGGTAMRYSRSGRCLAASVGL